MGNVCKRLKSLFNKCSCKDIECDCNISCCSPTFIDDDSIRNMRNSPKNSPKGGQIKLNDSIKSLPKLIV